MTKRFLSYDDSCLSEWKLLAVSSKYDYYLIFIMDLKDTTRLRFITLSAAQTLKISPVKTARPSLRSCFAITKLESVIHKSSV